VKDGITKLIEEELELANKKFPLFNSPHEGYAVILEEFEEAMEEKEDILTEMAYLKKRIFQNENKSAIYKIKCLKNSTINCISELIQLAAMCDKYIMSLRDKS